MTKFDTRQSAHKRGYDRTWQKIRTNYLSENPLCVECKRQGRLTPAKHVDHITPHKGNRELFYNPDNYQSLCASCHSEKTAREDGGFGQQKSSKASKACGLDGIPTDRNHHWKG